MHRNRFSSLSMAVSASKLKQTSLITLVISRSKWRAELGDRTANCIVVQILVELALILFSSIFCFVVDAAVRLLVPWLWLLARSSYRENSC